jgi:hypothetical protein
MAALGEKLIDQPRPQSFKPMILQGVEWQPFELPDNHHLKQRFKMLDVQTLIANYSQQGEFLEGQLKADEKDIFVAKYSAFRNSETGRVWSEGVWSEGVHTYLPQTDQVVFYREQKPEGERIVRAPFERASAVVGKMMRPLGLYPERFEVSSFPSEAQLLEISRA